MHGWEDSNPQPTVLETAALPIEPLTYLFSFFKSYVLSNDRIVLLEFNSIRMVSFILFCRITITCICSTF